MSITENVPNLRDEIFKSVSDQTVVAEIIADDAGILIGTQAVEQCAQELGLELLLLLEEGNEVIPGSVLARYKGNPKQIAKGEEHLIDLLAKPSGIAAAARAFVSAAGDRPRIVSGAWKKLPMSQKQMIRSSVEAGGADFRMSRVNFVSVCCC